MMKTNPLRPGPVGQATTILAACTACALMSACSSPQVRSQVSAQAHAGQLAVEQMQGSSPQDSSLVPRDGELVAGTLADAHRRAQQQVAPAVLRRSTQPWVTGQSVALGHELQALPPIFREPLVLAYPERASLRQVVDRLVSLTRVPMRIADAELARGGLVTAVTGSPAQAPAPQLSMQWSGSLQAYLDHVTDLLGISWEYRDDAVIFERLRTEFFSLDAFDGETSYSMSMTGADAAAGGGAGGGTTAVAGTSSSSAEASVHDSGKSNAVSSALAALKQMVKDTPGSEVQRVEGSGRVIVTTNKSAMARVRDFIRAENASVNRQAHIQLDIYSVRSSEADQRGVDWTTVLSQASKAYGARLLSPTTLTTTTAGSLALSILDAKASPDSGTARRFGGSAVLLNSMNEAGLTTEYRPVSLIGRHRQWVRKASLTAQAYVSETTPAAGSIAGTGTPGLKTATVTYGDRYVMQPIIQDNGQIILRFGIGLSSLVGIANFTSGSGTSQQTVQTPETSSILDQAEVVLKPGQILAVTGLSRIVAQEDGRSLAEGASMALGGSRKTSRVREDFIIFVRPTVL